MKAILLTYDKQLCFAQLLIKRYEELVADTNFEFLVPYNEEKNNYISSKVFDIVRIPTASDIISTMQSLLENIDDDEWVFWCIDDRYPMRIEEKRFSNIINGIEKGDFDDYRGVKLIHWREVLVGKTEEIGGLGFQLQREHEHFGFWHHQFLRAKTLRDFFITENYEKLNNIGKINYYQIGINNNRCIAGTLVPMTKIVSFAEPLSGQRLYANAVSDLEKYGLDVPDFKRLDEHAAFVDCMYQLEKFAIPKRVPAEYYYKEMVYK